MPEPNFVFLSRKNLLYAVNAALGTEIFRRTYVFDKKQGQEIDTLQDGKFTCAYFVSGILTLFMLIDHPHSVVGTTISKMKEAGWYEIDQPKPGAVVHWPAGPKGHEHIGFVVDADVCISTSSDAGVPVKHGRLSHDGAEPIGYYWHSKLDVDAQNIA